MRRFRVGSFATALALASAVACGGRARGDGSGDAPSVSAGTGGANGAGTAGSRADTSAGGATPTAGGAGATVAGSGAGAAEADSDLSNSCPQASSNRCPAIEIDIGFTRDAVEPGTKVWVEPLQTPEYTHGLPADVPEIEPSKWDRSALPAGACVLRIHGLSGACLQRGLLYVGTCASLADPEASHVVPFGYYEGSSCGQGIAPGCPSADASDWRNGQWWYLVARGEDTDLVVCAPQCATAFGLEKHACLRMAGSG